jgi:CO/xanthine dehydrogenase Mo-binding subunit
MSGFGAALPPTDGKPRLPGSLHNNRRLAQWLSFSADGVVTITPGKVELGQGAVTALLQMAAEELDVAPARIRMVSGDTALTPDEGFTAGSQSVEYSGTALRCAAIHQAERRELGGRLGVVVRKELERESDGVGLVTLG